MLVLTKIKIKNRFTKKYLRNLDFMTRKQHVICQTTSVFRPVKQDTGRKIKSTHHFHYLFYCTDTINLKPNNKMLNIHLGDRAKLLQ